MPASTALRRIAAALLFLALAAGATAAEPKTRVGNEASETVRRWIKARNCGVAVERLKTGLSEGYPEVKLLAGSMYEHGVCVKRDWDKAVDFYAQAFEAGLRDGAERLAAGYADPAGGNDVAAALWWAQRGMGARFARCAVSREAAGDPDRFVTELASWPQQRLALCNYVVGVMATIAAEAKYPEQAVDFAVGGKVTVRFLADLARVELRKDEAREYQLLGLVDGDALRDRKGTEVTGAFEKVLGEVAGRALKRYPQPPGIPAGTTVEMTYDFTIEFDGN